MRLLPLKVSTLTASLPGLLALAAPHVGGQTADAVTELERFIAQETALSASGDILPTSRSVGSVFGPLPLVDTPRAVTVLTPELLRLLDIQDFSDLARIGAGTQQINYYGVPGVPSFRGAKAGVFLNGVQRAWQRNEMPLSFGSVEAMDLVKGPAPAHFGASQIGGYANLLPKSPFFDRKRGSITVEIGQYDHYRVQLDLGGPVLIGDRPSAYRVSLTGQVADDYYNRVGNDFLSAYGAVKSQLADGVTLFTGGEYFRYRSNENAGWNRPTQDLIDRGEYIIGEPVSLTSPEWGGRVVRTLIEYPHTAHLAPAFATPLVALAIPGDVARARIPAELRAHLIDMNDPATVARVYQVLPASAIPPFASPGLQPVTEAAMAQVTKATQDVYIYTPEYFAAGGEVLTERIDGRTVLADEADFADSSNLLYFADLEITRNPDRTIKGQFLLDRIKTNKLSTYGYGIDTEQLVLETKVHATESFAWWEGVTATYGASARYTDAKLLQDYFAEPFSRRDITRDTISPNSVVPAGGQRGPDGRNFWSPTAQGGANAHSKLWQLSAFSHAQARLTQRLQLIGSLLVAHAPYRTRYPSEVDLVPADDPRRDPVSAEKNYTTFSLSPVFEVRPGLNLYATWQHGTALDPLMGGPIVNEGNFARGELWEVGAKTELMDGRYFASLAAYQWEQTAFDERTNRAEPLEGEGVELEFTAALTERLTLLLAATHQRVWRNSPLPFRPGAYTPEQWALYGGVLGFLTPEGRPASNPNLIYPGSPEAQAKAFLVYRFDSGWAIAGGPIWSEAYWHNFERTLRLPESVVWHGSISYRRPKWESTLTLENITDEDYFRSAEPVFAANTLLTKAPGFNAKISVTLRF